MPTRPTPGGSNNTWGAELNAWLDSGFTLTGGKLNLTVPAQTGTPEGSHNAGLIPIATAASFNQGGSATPSTTTSYLTPAIYLERFSNSTAAAQSSFSNGFLTAPLEIDVVIGPADFQAHTGLSARLYSDSAFPAGHTNGQVGITTQSECHAPGGSQNRDLWGANFNVLYAGAGTAPTLFVGVEVDLSPGSAMTNTARPGTGGQRHIGYMAQTTSFAGNSGVWVTSWNGTNNNLGPGWYIGVQAEAWFQTWAGFFRNTLNAAGAGGVYVETQFANANTSMLECNITGAGALFKVSGDTTSPVSLQIGGALHNLAQQTAGGITGGFVAGAGTAMNSASTSTGTSGTAAYTFGDVVRALKNLGFLAV